MPLFSGAAWRSNPQCLPPSQPPARGSCARWGSWPTSIAATKCATVILPSPRILLNSAGLFASYAAEFELGDRFLYEAAELFRAGGHDESLSRSLQVRAGLLIDLGKLADAERAAREAFDAARRSESDEEQCDSLAVLGDALGLQGQTTEAVATFKAASQAQSRAISIADLFSVRGIQWAGLLIRLGRTADARSITEANLEICERYDWRDDAAGCHLLLGRLNILAGAYDAATATSRRPRLLFAPGIFCLGFARCCSHNPTWIAEGERLMTLSATSKKLSLLLRRDGSHCISPTRWCSAVAYILTAARPHRLAPAICSETRRNRRWTTLTMPAFLPNAAATRGRSGMRRC